jgi:quercetin dioxygenase-like cupin family protein
MRFAEEGNMSDEFFPKEILALPEADVTFPGVRGRLLQGPDEQLVFFEIDAVGEVEPHSHGAQWGVVLDGAMDLTIDRETRHYSRGDTYYIPAGVVHSARFDTRTRVIDFFAESHRYGIKPKGEQ